MSNEFSWSAAREARLDRAIDRAVRDMMQVDPRPGLRRRVLVANQRIEAGGNVSALGADRIRDRGGDACR